MSIRRAAAVDLAWINQRYREVDFVASTARDVIAVAEIAGVPAGLGRLVPLDAGSAELGGIVVFPEFRGRGLATRIVAYLIGHADSETLYCLPFAALQGMYAAAGFMPVAEHEAVPPALAAKHAWCNRHYQEPVLLLVRSRDPGG